MFTNGNDQVVKSFVLLNIEDDEVTFISFEGNIPREDLENAIVKGAE